MAFKKNLLKAKNLAAGAEKRILPSLKVEHLDRLHFHISNGTKRIKDLNVRILFGTSEGSKILLADSTVWFEDGIFEREFSYQLPPTYSGTGIVMSVPVIAPLLYDVILQNTGDTDLTDLHVSVMGQEI